ncbi:MAG: FtsX-like permease family protein [Propionibacteriaceae bacterium]|jgi:putative ABC transport system permease protein|nr:FtsX-like permease family protein [Propionibacteriaceae bacterium]
MQVVKRALLYIVRKWMKTAILFLLLTTISTLLMSGLAMLDANQKQATQVRGSTGTSFTVKAPVSAKQTYLTDDQVKRIGATEGIRAYNAAMPYSVDLLGLKKPNSSGIPMLDSMMFGYGSYNSEYHALFLSHEYQLVEGRHVKDRGSEALVAKRFAQKNNLKVGDKFPIHLSTMNYMDPTYHDKADKHELTIVGLYDVDDKRARTYDKNNQSDMSAFIDKEDWIFTSMDVAETMVKADPGTYGIDQATFYVDDAAQLGTIIDRVKQLPGIDWSYYTLQTNDVTYQNVADSVSSTTSLISTLIIITTVVSVLVLVLLLSMRMHARRSEMGVFLALGIGKPRIVAQCLLESLIVAAIAFPAAYLLARSLATHLGTLFGKAPDTVAVTTGHLATVAIWGSLLLIAAVLASCWTVMRVTPKQILAQMS